MITFNLHYIKDKNEQFCTDFFPTNFKGEEALIKPGYDYFLLPRSVEYYGKVTWIKSSETDIPETELPDGAIIMAQKDYNSRNGADLRLIALEQDEEEVFSIRLIGETYERKFQWDGSLVW